MKASSFIEIVLNFKFSAAFTFWKIRIYLYFFGVIFTNDSVDAHDLTG